MAEITIDIQSLTKQYDSKDKLALNSLSLTIHAGEVYGFLGPNGAGKSTTIRLLMNYLEPTSGSATILGKNIVTDSVEIKRSVGYLAGDFAVYPKMTGRQYLQYLDELQGGGSMVHARRLAKMFDADIDKKLGDLSRGNRQKIGLIQAFMHQPSVLILDEPSSGLDPLMQEYFYQLVSEAKQRGATVFVSSHIMTEVQKMCDRVGIIRDGKLIAERVIADLELEAAQTFEITFAKKAPLAELKKVPGLAIQNQAGNRVSIHMRGELKGLFSVLARHDVSKIDASNLDLEDTFMHFYQDEELTV